MSSLPNSVWTAYLLQLIAALPAVCFNNSATGVATDAMTWSGAYAFDSQPAPLTLSFKALEHRHMVHVLQRDGRDRTRAVQTSWFNGKTRRFFSI